MNSVEIEKIIDKEINGIWYITNAHGVDLRKCLIKPIRQIYFSFDKLQRFDLWTVLEETPDGNGYKICYDDKDNTFGLGVLSEKDELIYLGPYGTFLETLEAM